MKKHFFSMVAALSMLTACGGASQQTTAEAEKFDYNVEQFADLHSSKNNWFII